jgi:hypothetical protein
MPKKVDPGLGVLRDCCTGRRTHLWIMERGEAHLPECAETASTDSTQWRHRLGSDVQRLPRLCHNHIPVPSNELYQQRESTKEGVSYHRRHPCQKAESKADATFGITYNANLVSAGHPTAIRTHGEYPSVKARRRRSQIITTTTPDDTVWQLTRKTLQRKLPVGRLRAAKYLRVVECKSTH